VNARLSPRSERRFQFFKFVVAPIFRRLNLICVPEARDVKRWESLGVERDLIRQTGNIKYDTEVIGTDVARPRASLEALGIEASRPVMFGGSTHAGEEMILAKIFLALREKFPALLLVIAPRHFERARAIRARLEQLSLRVALRSERDTTRRSAIDCLLLDSTGELQNWYSIATVTFVGKSLTAHGGQNPVEPLLAGNPVLFGPHMENFLSLARSLVAQQAAIQIADAADLQREFARLLRDRCARERLVANAIKVLVAHRGATARAAEFILNLRSAPRVDG
jgi:3-deoxy-D-manno-octulosonic-acid transferase